MIISVVRTTPGFQLVGFLTGLLHEKLERDRQNLFANIGYFECDGRDFRNFALTYKHKTVLSVDMVCC